MFYVRYNGGMRKVIPRRLKFWEKFLKITAEQALLTPTKPTEQNDYITEKATLHDAYQTKSFERTSYHPKKNPP